jgi:uncharacterized membrane protein
MTILDRFAALGTGDALALLFLFAGAAWIGWRIEHTSATRPSVTWVMSAYRRAWMREMVTREPRIFDAQVMASLRQGTSFFASSALIGLGGVLAMASNTAPLEGLAQALAQTDLPPVVWQVKLVPVLLFLTSAFLKFVWSNRLFGYASVVMAAVPNDIADPVAIPRADQAAEVNIRAAWNFNRGLRSMYFALAALAWLAGPVALVLATVFTIWTLWRREFASASRSVLLSQPLPAEGGLGPHGG